MPEHAPRPPALPGRRTLLKRLAAGAGMAAFARWSGATVPEPPAIRGKGYRLVKDWDFATTIREQRALRAEFFTRYMYNQGQLDFLNDEWTRYRDNDNHVFEQQALALVARLHEPAPAPGKIESGMLRSKWSGQYGYFECGMKVPPGRGMWPAFWLNPENGKWPPEIDIVEIVNNGRDTTANSFHFAKSGLKESLPVRNSQLTKHHSYVPGFDFKDAFHTFAAEWTVDNVRFFVDDLLVVDRQFRWVDKDGADGGPAHVLVNLAVGGDWPGPPSGAQSFPARLLVKHMRVWQR